MIADVLAAYAIDVAPFRRSARNISYQISNLRKWWGARRVSDISARTCREYASSRTPAAARTDLEKLGAALKHWRQEYEPSMAMPRIVKPAPPESREQWLTRSEAARLLWAARRTPHLARFILLGIYTGSRSAVLRELQWAWIDFHSKIMRRRAPREADNATKRRPSVRLGARILAHLRRWRRLDGGRCPYVVQYRGKPILDAFRSSWERARKRAQLPAGVTPHTLRHTRATWMMQNRVDPWEAAGSLGMSVRVLEKTYGHHHPDWQRHAAEV